MFVHIREFRTSIFSSDTWERMVNMRATSTIVKKDGTRELKGVSKIHKVLHCKNSAKTTWNRDINASTNILMLLMRRVAGLPRPVEFQSG